MPTASTNRADAGAGTPPGRGMRIENSTQTALQNARRLLRTHGLDAEAGQILERLASADAGTHSIVVVGEVGRGKSTIVNALLGQPDLSPVGYGETTGAYISFVPPTDELPAGSAHLEFPDGHTTAIELERVRDWVTVDGEALATADGDAPIGAVVAAASELLPGVAIVDTPGSGGLNPAHARLALGRAQKASVLLLVTDAGGRLTRPALDFLLACASHVESAVIVMSKTDKNPRAWREIRDENRAILREVSPRFAEAPIVGVSGFRALQALVEEDAEERERLIASSNIDELASVLRARLSKSDQIPAANALRQTQSLLGLVVKKLERELLATSGSAQSIKDLTAEVARIEALETQQSRWRLDFDRDFGDLRTDVAGEIVRRTDALTAEWEHNLSAKRWGINARTAQEMRVEMCAGVAAIDEDVRELISTRLREAIERMFSTAQLGNYSAAFWEPTASTPRASAVRYALWKDDGGDLDLSVLFQGVMGANLASTGASALAGGAAAAAGLTVASFLGPMMVPIALLGGGSMVAIGLFTRKAHRNKSNLRSFLLQTCSNLRTDLVEEFNTRLRHIKPEIVLNFERDLATALRELRENVKTAKLQATSSAQARNDRLKALQHESGLVLEQLTASDKEISRLLG